MARPRHGRGGRCEASCRHTGVPGGLARRGWSYKEPVQQRFNSVWRPKAPGARGGAVAALQSATHCRGPHQAGRWWVPPGGQQAAWQRTCSTCIPHLYGRAGAAGVGAPAAAAARMAPRGDGVDCRLDCCGMGRQTLQHAHLRLPAHTSRQHHARWAPAAGAAVLLRAALRLATDPAERPPASAAARCPPAAAVGASQARSISLASATHVAAPNDFSPPVDTRDSSPGLSLGHATRPAQAPPTPGHCFRRWRSRPGTRTGAGAPCSAACGARGGGVQGRARDVAARVCVFGATEALKPNPDAPLFPGPGPASRSRWPPAAARRWRRRALPQLPPPLPP